MNSRILVTGGAGFIGSNLIHALIAEDQFVVNLDKLTYAGNPQNLSGLENASHYHFVHGDINDAELLARLFAEHCFDAVMHLAAESHVDRSLAVPEDFVMTNLVGTFQLLQASRNYLDTTKKPDFRFIHVSTDEVYGSLEADAPAFSETSAYAPNNPYSASKAGSDHLARAFFRSYDLPVITTNCSNNFGPRQHSEKLIPSFISKIRHHQPLPVYGDGKHIRDWLFVDDHCRALTTILKKGTVGEVYHIGGNCEKTNLEVVHTLLEMIPNSDRGLISFVADRPGHDRRYSMDCRKLESELGWKPRESFESGLRKTIQWYLDN